MAYFFPEKIPCKPVPTKAFPKNIRGLLACIFLQVDAIPVKALKNKELKGSRSVKEPNKFHNYETEKITRKASDAAEYIELFGFSTQDCHA